MSIKTIAGGFHIHDDIADDKGRLGIGTDGSFFQPPQAVLHNLNDIISQQAQAGILTPETANAAPHIGATTTTAAVVSVARASVTATGAQSLDDNGQTYAVFSPDGSKVAFYASDLGAGGTGGIFVKDLASGSLTLVSTDANGVNIGGGYQIGQFSADGTKFAFSFSFSTLNPAADPTTIQVFVKNLVTGAITNVSTTAAGAFANGTSLFGSFSPDGTKVAFESWGSNLVAGDGNSNPDVFVKDLTTGAVTLVSGASVPGAGHGGWFSPDGTKIAFASTSVYGPDETNFPPGQPQEIFVRDVASGVISLVSGFSNGLVGNNASAFDGFSPDGTKILFESASTNLPPGAGWNAYLKDLTSGTITQVASNLSAPFQNGGLGEARLSADGSKLIYASTQAAQFGGSDTTNEIFVKDLNTGAISLLSQTGLGGVADGNSYRPSLSTDGSKLVYNSYADNLAAGDINETGDAFVASLGYVSKAAPVALAAGLTLSDADSANLTGATVAISAGFQSGDTLSATTAGTAITAGYNAATHVLTLTGSDTLAHYQSVLRGVAFSNATNNDPAAAPTRTISWQVDDGNAVNHASNVSTTTINVVDVATGTHTGGVKITGTFIEGHTLTADTSALADPNGLGTLHYFWQRENGDGLTDVGSDQSTYTLVGDDVGGSVKLTVGYLDGHGNTEAVTDEAFGIEGVNHGPAGTAVLSGTFATGSVLTADLSNVTDADGFPDSGIEYLWFRKLNGHSTVIQDGTSATYTVTAADAGAKLIVDAIYTDNHRAPETVFLNTDALNVPNHLATGGVVVTGATTVGQTLTADTSTLADADGLGALTYTWERSFFGFANLVTIGTDQPTYVLTNADVNDVIRVYIHYADGHGNTEAVVSAISGQVTAPVTSTGHPAISNTGNQVAYTEGGAAVVIDSGLTLSDPNSATLASATVSTGVSGDTLGFVNQNGITGTFTRDQFGAGTLALSGTASIANYQAALRSVTYSSISDNPTIFGNQRAHVVGWQVNDGTAGTVAAAISTVTVAGINNAPVITGSGYASDYTEQNGPNFATVGLALSDDDSLTYSGATATITGGFVAGDLLSVTPQGSNITANYNAATHVLTLSGLASRDDYAQTIRFIGFSSTSDDPTAGGASLIRTISVQTNDGGAVNNLSNVATVQVFVQPVNDAPVLSGAGNTVTTSVLAPAIAVDPGLVVGDVDSVSLNGATVTISSGFVAGDTLAFTAQSGITGNYNVDTHILTLSGTAGLAVYQAALRTVTYASSSADPTAGGNTSRTISWHVDDGGDFNHSSNTVTSTVNIANQNIAPALGGAGNTVSYVEQASGTTLDGALTLTDSDSANLAGATVTISAGFVAGDLLNFVGQNGIAGSYDAASHKLTLSGASSVANYQTALRSVTFSSPSDNPDNFGANPARTITWTADDGAAVNHASNSVTTSITITAVDDPPGVHNDAFAGDEQFALGSGLNVFADNGSGVDSDPDSHSLAVTAVNGVSASVGHEITLASGALLTLNANGTFYYDSNGAFDALAAPGSGATNISASDSFSYTINGGTVETATITITGVDNNDVLHATAGNDTIDGGIGHDTLILTGNQSDYLYVYNPATHAYTVTDERGGSPDGTDTVRNVETFRFANGDFDVSTASSITGNAAGGSTTTTYDASGAYAWASQVTDTDAQNSLASQSIVTDGGTRWLNSYDTTGTQSWLWTTSSFDAGGHQLLQLVTNDDGTHALTLFDAANQYAWANATLTYDANWVQTGLTGTNDNGSHTITMANIAAGLDQALWFTTPYDANLGAPLAVPLIGGGNTDILYGHAGSDAINGGGGNDLIVGGAGDDQLTGGSGDDHFVFAFGDGIDIITDFLPGNAGGDVIDLHGYGVTSFTALQALMSQSSTDTIIALDAQNHITLHNVTLAQLNAGDFLFS